VATGEVTAAPLPKTRNLSPEFLARTWKPGQSGNPNGRPKKLTNPLEEILASKVPNDPEKRTYARLLVESMVKRAITKSDMLMKEIFDRVEGRVSIPEEERLGNIGVEVVVIDIPRPDRSAINVTPAPKPVEPSPNGSKPDPRPQQ